MVGRCGICDREIGDSDPRQVNGRHVLCAICAIDPVTPVAKAKTEEIRECGNCGRTLGRLEPGLSFKGYTICVDCKTRLDASIAPQKPATERLAEGTITVLWFLFWGVVIFVFGLTVLPAFWRLAVHM